MTKFLLAVHVLAAIVAIGPVTVAASMFPPAARRALASPDDPRAVETVRLLLRVCRVYAVVGVVVPVFGFATARAMGVLGDTWLIVSMALTALAALVLVALVLPRQTTLAEGLVEAERPRTVEEEAERPGTVEEAERPGTVEEAERPGTVEEAGGGGGGPLHTAVPAVPAAPAAPADTRRATVQLAMFTGLFNFLWAAVTVLMIVRPGSTTGA
ncbi:DUF2269 family protein [Streptomyces sp. NPDC015220]|uniref:DUF2269 family protein n=1 Tax=Streptomyces sp. NPDC015220 TaxID=3364947 RepID=UPI0036FA6F22